MAFNHAIATRLYANNGRFNTQYTKMSPMAYRIISHTLVLNYAACHSMYSY